METKSVQSLIKAYNDAAAALRSVTQEQVVQLFVDVMKEHPVLKAVRWTQYTPYFNDGDPCVFSVAERYYLFEGAEEAEEDDSDYDEEAPGFEYHAQTDEQKAAVAALPDLPDELLQDVFDDHVRVIIRCDGTCKVMEYSHD